MLTPKPIIRQPEEKPFLSGNQEFTVETTTLYEIPIPVPANIAYVMYKRYGIVPLRRPVATKPTPTSIAEIKSVILGPSFLQIRLPKKAPRQKKHIVNVKLKARTESLQLNSDLKGIFNIDQAYNTPEKSIVKIPVIR